MRLKEIKENSNVMVSSNFDKMTNDQLAEKYFEYLLAQKSACTHEKYSEQINKFLDFIRGYKIRDITSNDIGLWLQEKGKIGNSTKHIYLTVLSSFFEYLKINGYTMIGNPALQSKKLLSKKINVQHEPVPLDEVRKIIKSITHPRDKAIIAVFVKTGCRCNELTNLKVSDVETDRIWIRFRKGSKNGEKDTQVPLDNELKSILNIWLSVRPPGSDYLFTSFYGQGLTNARIRHITSRLAGIHPHQLRYSFTTFLSENRCNVNVIEKLRGDSARSMTSYYTKLGWDTVKKEYLAAMPKIL
ncbi:tyrosine-type recombinase/integrase [Patescibacteria group bacterium]|nr:tyrosine-type recombinase/integrase [Patescibacteria group bacterium]